MAPSKGGELRERASAGHSVSALHVRTASGGFQKHQSAPLPRLQPLETTSSPTASVVNEELPAPMAAAAPKRVAVFVEPSPFTYVCGYKNRYCNMIRHLVEEGCEVLVVTTGKGVSAPGTDTSAYRDAPENYHGARVVSSFAIGCPWYWQLPLSLALSPRIFSELRKFNPDLIHCSTPGLMVFSAWLYSKLLRLPLVFAYHTHLPKYLPRYNISFLIPALWSLLRLHRIAHLTLVTSTMLRNEFLEQDAAPAESLQVWRKGIDTDMFNPRFKSQEMRERLTAGNPEAPVLVHVGRLGSEKNLKFLKGMLARLPGARLAFVGDGPAREELEAHFRGTPTVFLGMLHGDELSAAYASGDVFVMPSESETLGFVVLEAMASQVPVVAVKAGGIPDIIHSEGVGGYLYQPGDIEGATNLVKRLLDNDELRMAAGAAAREETTKWDWRAATRQLLNAQYPVAMAAAKAEYGSETSPRPSGDSQTRQGEAGAPAFA
ncbi:unnamed protein product [Ostreobium quekettii]|uniref:Glycosyltransferase subfamily 4-like N-terminal domain-containing protein n=1 Tax=Ostreobium quekettii TaxID=121088 RepID=A0A8S1J0B6_9CHLO|nr:unnamed protein product [Ostreobium quekettii]|eukprot:evm.model.scf_1112.4 EVM.evm.TU.scf_1112.4   scf_1112:15709-22750(+)